MEKFNGINNGNDAWASVLNCIEDAIAERIYQAEGDVVHTDWTEKDWENYIDENCSIRNIDDYMDCISDLSMIDDDEEFAEVTSIAFSIMRDRMLFGK